MKIDFRALQALKKQKKIKAPTNYGTLAYKSFNKKNNEYQKKNTTNTN